MTNHPVTCTLAHADARHEHAPNTTADVKTNIAICTEQQTMLTEACLPVYLVKRTQETYASLVL